MKRIKGMIFDLKQNFWRGLYFNCWALINRLSNISEFAAKHVVTTQQRDDGYNGGERYKWRQRY